MRIYICSSFELDLNDFDYESNFDFFSYMNRLILFNKLKKKKSKKKKLKKRKK